ncbi:unnamed protein product [Pedinophyceae sp. YPF-701]|nr:unnamed protein product [Pedinophyceae sp. YPF-701]
MPGFRTWVGLLLVAALLLQRSNGQSLPPWYQGYRNGDEASCQAFLATYGISALALQPAAFTNPLDQSTAPGEAWHPSFAILPWKGANLPNYDRWAWGNRRFAATGRSWLLFEIKQSITALDATLQAASPHCDATCQARQRAALKSLFQALDGPNWTDDLWRNTWGSETLHHCCWPGVTCCSAGNTLPLNRITGTGEVRMFVDTSFRGIACVQRAGVASVDFEHLPGLRTASAGNTRTVPLGVFAALASSLEYVNLKRMGVTGALPDDVLSAQLLRAFHVEQNDLEGTIPDHSTFLTDPATPGWSSHLLLRHWAIGDNARLTGRLPDSLPFCLSLQYIEFQNNAMLGPLPLGFTGGPPDTRFFSGAGNRIAGEVFGLPPGQSFSDAQLLFDDIGIWDAVQDLRVGTISLRGNQLSGTIPQYMAIFAYEYLDLGENALSGTIPTNIASPARIRSIRLDRNDLTGQLPDPLTPWGLEELDVCLNAGLSGSFPRSLADIRTLKLCRVAGTAMFGELPEEVGALPQLTELDVSETLMQHNASRPNSRGELLPEFLRLTEERTVPNAALGFDPHLLCPSVVVANATAQCGGALGTCVSGLDLSVGMSPSYFHYRGCRCSSGYRKSHVDLSGAELSRVVQSFTDPAAGWPNDAAYVDTFLPRQRVVCVPDDDHLVVIVSTVVAGSVFLVLIIVLAVLFFLWRDRIAVVLMERRKRAGPPGAGREITLVLTDVQDSTALWEASPHEMATANSMHDAILRAYLARWHGYEVTTEGDSFLLAFHEPTDAIGWCLSVQQALHVANWPESMRGHEGALDPSPTSLGKQPGRASKEILRTSWLGQVGRNNTPNEDERVTCSTPHRRGSASGARDLRRSTIPSDPGGPNAGLARPSQDGFVRNGSEEGTVAPPGPEGDPSALLVDDGARFFRGLRVRMSVATAHCEHATTHRMTRRLEYDGPVVTLVNAIQEVTRGGQILMCAQTYEGVHARHPIIAAKLFECSPHKRLAKLARASGTGTRSMGSRRGRKSGASVLRDALMRSRTGSQAGVASEHVASPGPEPTRSATHLGSPASIPVAASFTEDLASPAPPVENGGAAAPPSRRQPVWAPTLETNMEASASAPPNEDDIAIAAPAKPSRVRFDSGIVDEFASDSVAGRPGASLVADPSPTPTSMPHARSGSQSFGIMASLRAVMTGSLRGADTREDRMVQDGFSANGRGDARGSEWDLLMLDMGEYDLGLPQGVHLYQALAPFLEERARFCAEIPRHLMKSPGYFHAPGTTAPMVPARSACPHGVAYLACSACAPCVLRLPDVVIVFCGPVSIDELYKHDRHATQEALEVYKSVTREVLLRYDGYECQELSGAFMLAFHSLGDAFLFGSALQLALLGAHWPRKLLKSPCAAVERGSDGAVQRRGLRVRVGVCRGMPVKVLPHTATGRTDYFGPLVNRAARMCFAAAQGGQVIGTAEQAGAALLEMLEQPVESGAKGLTRHFFRKPCVLPQALASESGRLISETVESEIRLSLTGQTPMNLRFMSECGLTSEAAQAFQDAQMLAEALGQTNGPRLPLGRGNSEDMKVPRPDVPARASSAVRTSVATSRGADRSDFPHSTREPVPSRSERRFRVEARSHADASAAEFRRGNSLGGAGRDAEYTWRVEACRIVLRHVGQFRLKGVSGDYHLASIAPKSLAEVQHSLPTAKKAKLLREPGGTLLEGVALMPILEHVAPGVSERAASRVRSRVGSKFNKRYLSRAESHGIDGLGRRIATKLSGTFSKRDLSQEIVRPEDHPHSPRALAKASTGVDPGDLTGLCMVLEHHGETPQPSKQNSHNDGNQTASNAQDENASEH